MGQGVHEDIPGGDVFPAGQGVQEVAGSIVESLKVPAGQVEHDIGLLPPALELKVPEEHFIQASDITLTVFGLYLPAGQRVHAD